MQNETPTSETPRIPYKPFPSFSQWASTPLDTHRWDEWASRLNSQTDVDARKLDKAYRLIRKIAAIETGAVEDLYQTSRGITYTIAWGTSLVEAVFREKGEKFRRFICSQLDAYELVLDFVTNKLPLCEAWIRALHKSICASQETHVVFTPQNEEQRRPLRKGEYKNEENFPRLRSGVIHCYASPLETPAEMRRLLTEITTQQFQEAHPGLQASYAHYAFVTVHPFSDGNGRVARALASVFTYRAARIPFLVFAKSREPYFDSLEAADKGDFAPFINACVDYGVTAMRMVEQTFQSADYAEEPELVERMESLFHTKGGYQRDDVEQAGNRLLLGMLSEIQSQFDEINREKKRMVLHQSMCEFTAPPPDDRFRRPVRGQNGFVIRIETPAPANTQIEFGYALEVPKDGFKHDQFILRNSKNSDEVFQIEIAGLLPEPTEATLMLMAIFARGILRKEWDRLNKQGEEVLRSKRYL